ncbi:MAG: apolipoprotein N-acyltransferase [Desulfobia sp.]
MTLTAPFLSALLLYLSSPGPGYYLCAWFALVPLFWMCQQTEPVKSSLLGFLSGFFYYTLMLRWVTISLENYGHLPWWISWPAMLLLAAYMGLYLAIFCWIISCWLKRYTLIWVAPVIWISLDFLRGFMFSGFPWQDLGYSQYSNPLLIQVADLVGYYGVTFLIVLVNTVIFSLLAGFAPFFNIDSLRSNHTYPFRQSALALMLISSALVYSFHQNNHYLSVGKQSGITTAIIQGSIDQEKKWRSGTACKTIDKYIDLSRQAAEKSGLDLMIWPETAIPFLYPENFLMKKVIRETVNKGAYSLLTGIPSYTNNGGKINYYNSALLIRSGLQLSFYHKQHLVPFGEYIPFKEKLKLPGPLVQSIGNFSAGESSAPLPAGQAKLGIMICFESIFPELARKEVASGADLLINITNDAWFGYSGAPVQHMAMAVFRAVENRRSLARAANTGISCFISPAGHIKQKTPLFKPLFIRTELPLLQKRTVYNLYGYLFPLICLVLSGIILFFLATNRVHR